MGMLAGDASGNAAVRHSSFAGDGHGGVLLTGDTLFQGNVGKVDTTAKAAVLFESLQQLKALPPETVVLPAHHYGYSTSTTLENEGLFNTFYGKCKTLHQFTMLLGIPDAILRPSPTCGEMEFEGDAAFLWRCCCPRNFKPKSTRL